MDISTIDQQIELLRKEEKSCKENLIRLEAQNKNLQQQYVSKKLMGILIGLLGGAFLSGLIWSQIIAATEGGSWSPSLIFEVLGYPFKSGEGFGPQFLSIILVWGSALLLCYIIFELLTNKTLRQIGCELKENSQEIPAMKLRISGIPKEIDSLLNQRKEISARLDAKRREAERIAQERQRQQLEYQRQQEARTRFENTVKKKASAVLGTPYIEKLGKIFAEKMVCRIIAANRDSSVKTVNCDYQIAVDSYGVEGWDALLEAEMKCQPHLRPEEHQKLQEEFGYSLETYVNDRIKPIENYQDQAILAVAVAFTVQNIVTERLSEDPCGSAYQISYKLEKKQQQEYDAYLEKDVTTNVYMQVTLSYNAPNLNFIAAKSAFAPE